MSISPSTMISSLPPAKTARNASQRSKKPKSSCCRRSAGAQSVCRSSMMAVCKAAASSSPYAPRVKAFGRAFPSCASLKSSLKKRFACRWSLPATLLHPSPVRQPQGHRLPTSLKIPRWAAYSEAPRGSLTVWRIASVRNPVNPSSKRRSRKYPSNRLSRRNRRK